MEMSEPLASWQAVATERAEAVVVLPDGYLQNERGLIMEHLARLRLPSIFGNQRDVIAGGLISYGADFVDSYRRAATYVDKIRKGTKPADLPVEQPTKFQLVINLKAAKMLGVTIPRRCLHAPIK
jgi:putative ABC transport system substrate-binding protein